MFKDFFDSYRNNLIPGIKLSLLVLIAGLFVAEGLWTGYQIWRINIWGMLYMILGLLVSAVVICTIVYIPPVLSRFDAPILSIIRIAVYFAMKKPLRSICYLLLLGALVLSIYAFPLALVIVPALYADLIRTYLEKDMLEFIAQNNLEELSETDEEDVPEDDNEESSVDLDKRLTRRKDRK